MNVPNLLTVEDLSLILGINEQTLRKLAKTEQLPCIRIHRRLRFDFNKLIEYFKDLEGGAA